MKRITDSVKAEVIRRTDLVALVRETVELKKSGSNFLGLCPFHGEKTPSFNVNPARQIFHCFGCGVGGDAFAFLMARDGLTFPEALRLLAERTGVPLAEEERTPEEEEQARRARDVKDWVLRANELACEFWEQCLWGPPGERARQYVLHARGLTEETARRHRLGYAPASWDQLVAHLGRQKIPLRILPETGLVRSREQGGLYDVFRDRVIMPVHDLQGRPLAFSGRVLDSPVKPGEQPPAKYMNSPETPVFRKGLNLFGLREARVGIRQKGYALLVEGNFDLLTLHQAGFDNAVAPLGTALTPEQVKLLRRFSERVYVCYDGDPAGRQAAMKTAALMAEAEMDARWVELPADEDPDSFLRAHGSSALGQLVEQAIPLPEALIRFHAPSRRSPIEEKLTAWERVAPVLGRVKHPLARQRYVALAADLLELDERQLHRYITHPIDPDQAASGSTIGRAGERKEEADQVVRHLLALLVDCPELVPRAVEAGILELLPQHPIKDAVKVLLQLSCNSNPPSAAEVVNGLADEQQRTYIEQLLVQGSVVRQEQAAQAFEDSFAWLRRRQLTQGRGPTVAGDGFRLPQVHVSPDATRAMNEATRRQDESAIQSQLAERFRRQLEVRLRMGKEPKE